MMMICIIYIYNLSFNKQGDISNLILYRGSIFFPSFTVAEDGSMLQPKLAARIRLQVACACDL